MISFYATYATQYCGVAPAVAAGGFVMWVYAGAIGSNILCGAMGLFSLKNKLICSKLIGIAAMAVLAFDDSLMSFFIASALIGATRGIRNVSYAPAVKRLSNQPDSTGYFAVAPLLTLPIALTLPVCTGWFLDGFPQLKADAYRIVFAAAGLLLVASLLSIVRADFNRLKTHG